MNSESLRRLLERSGSYPAIEAAAASGALHDLLPVKPFEHIGTVYHRLERVADPGFVDLPKVRLAVLLHEESPPWLPRVLATAGFGDFEPVVMGVIGSFGKIWKVPTDQEIRDYVAAERTHLGSLLLFELAHEGRAISQMERAAELGGLARDFARWRERLTA
jgi:hypothetical protein